MSSTARGAERVEADFYETPAGLADHVAADIRTLRVPGAIPMMKILDPGAGTARITVALRQHFPSAQRTALELPDQHRRDELERAAPGTDTIPGITVIEDDYLMPCEDVGGPFDLIVCNPPFTYAEAFVRRSLSLMRDPEQSTVAMLLRLGFLASAEREDLFAEFPPTAMRICVPRPNFQQGQPGKHGDSADYAWLFWGRAPAPFFGRYRWRRG